MEAVNDSTSIAKLCSCGTLSIVRKDKGNKRNVEELSPSQGKLLLQVNPNETRHHRYSIAVRTLIQSTKNIPNLNLQTDAHAVSAAKA